VVVQTKGRRLVERSTDPRLSIERGEGVGGKEEKEEKRGGRGLMGYF
jgi:hypothetical protein